MPSFWLTLATLLALLSSATLAAQDTDTAKPVTLKPASWWKSEVELRLEQATNNRGELESALANVKYEHRRALEFLIEFMPEPDLQSLKAEFLLQNIELAYQAINQVPWGKQIPEEIFFNDILPYANVDETREDWRDEMMKRCLPLVSDCKTPGEAALKLNRELFPLIDVRYATSRKKANQSPSESIEQSVASCTGLSILLTDACRSVGVPSRLAGIPSWTNKRGNHTWVEVWDDGWHFTGAAEPSDQLNNTWFQKDASQADNNKPLNRIYAVSFAKTGMYFPLVWSPRSKQTNAVNVTDRYTGDRKELSPNRTRVLISIFAADGTRLKREISITQLLSSDEPNEERRSPITGFTRDESADMNDILMLELPRATKWQISWTEEGKQIEFEHSTSDKSQTSWEIHLPGDE